MSSYIWINIASRQAITSTNADSFSEGPLGTHLSEICKMHNISY